MKTLGAEIRRLREACGLSQEQVAEVVGMTQGVIGHLENDRHKPKAETLYALSRALGVDCRHWEAFFTEPPAPPARKKPGPEAGKKRK